MTPETSAPNESASDASACSRCRDDAVLRVVRTEIEGRSAPVRTSSSDAADSTTVCRDCFARLRADPNASFNTLFETGDEPDRTRHFIKIERL